MNEWITDNLWIVLLVILVLSIVIVVMSILTFVFAKKAASNISKTNLKMTANVSYDSDNLGESLEITVFNNNYRDIVIHDFGFSYKNQVVSFIEEYSERRLTKGRVICPARSSLTYKVNPERIEKFVVAHNFNAKSISMIYLIAVDSVGNSNVYKDKALTKLFSERQKARLKIAKRKLHEEKVQDYKDTHDGNGPMSEGLWNLFHRKQITVPALIKKSASLIGDSTLTPETEKNNKLFNPAPVEPSDLSDSDILKPDGKGGYQTTDFGRTSDSKDLKLTFLDLNVPLKSKEVDSKKKK